MKKLIVLGILALFLVSSIGFVLANENNSGNESENAINLNTQENNSGENNQIQNQIKVLTQAQIQKIKQLKNRLQIHLNATECPENCTCTGSTIKCELNGQRQMTVVAGRSGNVIVQVKGVNASTNVTLYKSEGKLYGVFEDNETKRIMTPEQVQEKIKGKINAKLDDQEITLDEDGKYRVRTKKQSRLFFMFKVKERVNAEVDPETGEIIRVRNPWWGFLANDIKEEPLVGASCGTVTPGLEDECCQNKGYDAWDEEAVECVFSE